MEMIVLQVVLCVYLDKHRMWKGSNKIERHLPQPPKYSAYKNDLQEFVQTLKPCLLKLNYPSPFDGTKRPFDVNIGLKVRCVKVLNSPQ